MMTKRILSTIYIGTLDMDGVNNMTDVLADFITTLPLHIQERISPDMKNKRVLTILEQNGIQVPEDIMSVLEQKRAWIYDHEAIMNSMRPFKGNRVEDFPTIIRGTR